MQKRIKKSIETQHKINLHRHFTLSEYLYLHNNDDYHIINCNTLEVNRESLVSFIDDYLLKKYTQVIDNKLAIAYGVDKSYSYFDLFQYVLDLNKLVHHSKICFLKEIGFREFYYTLKNFNEDYDYKEGLIFELAYKIHKGMIKYNEIFKIVCDVVLKESKLRSDKAIFIATTSDPLITPERLESISTKAFPIQIPDLNNKYNSHLNYLNDEIKQRTVNSSSILYSNLKLKSNILGYTEKKGLFGKETYLVEKNPFTALIYGNRHVTEHIFHNFMYQSLFNKKGFIYFNFGAAAGMEDYINYFAHTFNLLDEVVYIHHGSKEFHELDLNLMIRNNKIVIIQLANTERVSAECVLDVYEDFHKLLSSITTDSSSEYPYSIFLDSLYKYPVSFFKSLDQLSDLKNLGYTSILSRSFIDEDIDVQFVNSFEHIFIFKSETPHFLLGMLKDHRINVRDALNMKYYQFFFYTNGHSDNKIYNSLIFV